MERPWQGATRARASGKAKQPHRSLEQGKERGSMSAMYSTEPIRIGVVANEPMRLEGLTSIFESHAKPGGAPRGPGGGARGGRRGSGAGGGGRGGGRRAT